jgi:hypothetical protein
MVGKGFLAIRGKGEKLASAEQFQNIKADG